MKFFNQESAYMARFLRLSPLIWYLLLAAGSFSCLIGIMAYAYYPLMRSLQHKKIYYASLQHDQFGFNEIALKEVRRKLAKAERQLQLYQAGNFPQHLFSWAQSFNLSLISYGCQPGIVHESSVMHTLIVRGSYENLYAFFENIESMIARSSISAWSLKMGEAVYDLELSIVEYL